MAAGVPAEAVLCEGESRHTLENLRNVRAALAAHGSPRLLVVTDPLHLARVAAYARGLGLDVSWSPARESPPHPGSLGWWARAAREAWMLHWYRVGVACSRAIGSRRMLSRVS